jgi:hypothetical protein
MSYLIVLNWVLNGQVHFQVALLNFGFYKFGSYLILVSIDQYADFHNWLCFIEVCMIVFMATWAFLMFIWSFPYLILFSPIYMTNSILEYTLVGNPWLRHHNTGRLGRRRRQAKCCQAMAAVEVCQCQMSRIHTGSIKGCGTSPGPPQRLPWPQSANVCDEHTDRQTPRLL